MLTSSSDSDEEWSPARYKQIQDANRIEIMNVMSLPGAVLDRILSFWWEDANQSHELQAVCTRLKMTRFTRTQLCTMCVEVGRKVRLHVGPVERACEALRAWCHEGRRKVMWMMLKHVRKSHTNLTTLCLQNFPY